MSDPLSPREEERCIELGIMAADDLYGPGAPRTCPVTLMSAKQIALDAGIAGVKVDAAAVIVLRYAARRWVQLIAG